MATSSGVPLYTGLASTNLRASSSVAISANTDPCRPSPVEQALRAAGDGSRAAYLEGLVAEPAHLHQLDIAEATEECLHVLQLGILGEALLPPEIVPPPPPPMITVRYGR